MEVFMRIEKATLDSLPFVEKITQETIDRMYPKYYPAGAVDFFRHHHNSTAICNDINNGAVYLLFESEKPVATVTIEKIISTVCLFKSPQDSIQSHRDKSSAWSFRRQYKCFHR